MTMGVSRVNIGLSPGERRNRALAANATVPRALCTLAPGPARAP